MGSATRQIRHAKKRLFLEAFSRVGTIKHAAEAAGVDRHSHHLWLQKDPEYAAAFAEAEEQAVEVLEREMRRRAVEGVEEPVWHKGEQVGSVRKYSDVLLIFALKAARPERYRDNHRVELAGTVTHVATTAFDVEIEQLLGAVAGQDGGLNVERNGASERLA